MTTDYQGRKRDEADEADEENVPLSQVSKRRKLKNEDVKDESESDDESLASIFKKKSKEKLKKVKLEEKDEDATADGKETVKKVTKTSKKVKNCLLYTSRCV